MGLNDKDKKVQLINTLEAYKIVSNLIASKFEGGTIFEAKGIYKHNNGVIITETTLRIELLFANENDVRELANTLKILFNQESIAVQKEIINSELW